MKRIFPAGFLLLAVLLALAACLPFATTASARRNFYFFEADLTSDHAGMVQVFFDTGNGFNETDSTSLPLKISARPVRYRLGLPIGTVRALRFDPIDRAGKMSIGRARVVSRFGRVLRAFGPEDFIAANQIATHAVHDGAFCFETVPDANDPITMVNLRGPLRLPYGCPQFLPVVLPIFTGVFAALLLAGAALRGSGLRAQLGRLAAGARAHPQLSIWLAALLSVTASTYPVIFMGRSFVSPNWGVNLLYDNFPTLPGYSSTRMESPHAADVGAIMWQQVPYSMVQHDAILRDGELPLWNRDNSCGTPLLGQGQSMFGDPLHCVVIAANGAAWAWDLKYLLAKWLFAAGLGLVVWRLVRHLPSAMLTALAADFTGFFIFRANHPAFFSFCYAPWILYCWVRIAQSRSRPEIVRWAVGLILANWIELNSGTVKEAYMLLLDLNLTGGLLLVCSEMPRGKKLLGIGLLAAAGGVFILLAAPVWMTLLDTIGQSYNSYANTAVFQIQPSFILGFFDEIFYRPLQKQGQVFCPSVNFLFLLGWLYFLVTLRRGGHSRLVYALAGGALLPLALAFGFIPSDWILQIPFLANVSHIDNTFSCALIMHIIPLAGVGFCTASRRLGTAEGRGDIAMILLLLMVPIFAYVSFGQTVHRQLWGPDQTFTVWPWGGGLRVDRFVWSSLWLLTAALVTLLFAVRHMLTRRHISRATFLLALTCLAVLLWRHGMQAPEIGGDQYVLHPAIRTDFHATSPAIKFIQDDHSAPFRTVGIGDNLAAGWTSAYRLEGLSGPDGLMNPYYRELCQGSGLDLVWDWRLMIDPASLKKLGPIYDFLGVKYYVASSRDHTTVSSVLSCVQSSDLDVYRSKTVWPRAFFTDRLAVYQIPADLAGLITSGDGRPFAAMQAKDTARPATLRTDLTGRTVSPAFNYKLTANSTCFEVKADGSGVIVLQEAWLADSFHVTVNGRPAKYFRVNHAFKGVCVPAAGTYRISFTYRPPHWRLSLVLTGIGLALMAGGALVFSRPEKRDGLRPPAAA